MDKTTIGFLGLLAILFLGQVVMTEAFYDASGADASGNVTISLSDLLSLLGPQPAAPAARPPAPAPRRSTDYSNMRNEIIGDVKSAVRNEVLNTQWTGLMNAGGNEPQVLDDSCIDTIADQQGADFMRYIPGKNPDDYIRKDSVPCYGCSIP
jgi:hypothetical protein